MRQIIYNDEVVFANTCNNYIVISHYNCHLKSYYVNYACAIYRFFNRGCPQKQFTQADVYYKTSAIDYMSNKLTNWNDVLSA